MSDYFIHDKAIVESDKIGEKTRIWAFTHVLPGAVIGKNVNLCDFCFVENDVTIGDNVTIKCGVYIWDGITIEDDVHIGPAVAFTNDVYPRSRNEDWVLDKTLIKKGASLGANSTIIAKHTIGAHAMVGAGAVVTKDVPDFALVYGNPATIKGYICVCGTKMSFTDEQYECTCGKKYRKEGDNVAFV